MDRFIERLPKAELHVHLEGTLEPEMSLALAKRNGVPLPYHTPAEILAAYNFHDLPSFLSIYYAAMNVLRTERDFYELTCAYLETAHAQNVVYAEMFFDPQAHTLRGVPFDTVIRGIHRAQLDAEERLGIHTQLILCFLRDKSADSAMQALEASLPYKDWIVGVGLDSDEKNNPPLKFKRVFHRARREGYMLTMHCDVNQENTHDHLWQCLVDIEVDRIDHGVNSLADEGLCREIRARQIGLTVCPVSNRFVVQSLTSREIHEMLDRDMLATVNSDDPAYFRAYMNENFIELVRDGAFTQQELVTLAGNAFHAAWIPEARRRFYLAQLRDYATRSATRSSSASNAATAESTSAAVTDSSG